MMTVRDLKFAGALVASLTVLAGPALAETNVYLVAKSFTATMPGGAAIPMWGFAKDADGNFATPADVGPATSPGPRIQVPVGETSLVIHVLNELSVPVSLMIPGQTAPSNPTWVDTAGTVVGTGARPFGDVTSRMRSLSAEAAPLGGTATYTYANPRPGSFIYHSSTNPAVQVPMGLYGAMTMNSAAGQAYAVGPLGNAAVPFTNEALLFYSEIDPNLNNAVVGGTFGTPAYPSTIDYRPQYFLINGAPYPAAAPILQQPITTADTLLVRFFNAGLRTIVPAANGLRWNLVAEDGFASKSVLNAYTVQLSAGQTKDAILTPKTVGQFTIAERRMSITNAGTSPGGMIVKLDIVAGGGPTVPVALNDNFNMVQGTILTVPAPGVLANDTPPTGMTARLAGLVSTGSLSLRTNGSFTYTPPASFTGSATFKYAARLGTLTSAPATVTINVTPANSPPVANADGPFDTYAEVPLSVPAPGLLGNDTDANGNALTAVGLTNNTPAAGSVTLNANGSFLFTPAAGYTGPASFTYFANDGTVNSVTPATVSLNVLAPVAVADTYTVNEDTILTVTVLPGVLGNDMPSTGLTAQLAGVVSPSGTLALNANGSFTYTPVANFNGPVTFDYTAKSGSVASAPATVTINVTPVNDRPVANNDGPYTTGAGVPLNVAAAGVLANDTDIDGGALTAVLSTGPGNGTLTLNADGSFVYTPTVGLSGPDSFTYYANDGTANSAAPATVSITVNPPVVVLAQPNTPPVANRDDARIVRNASTTIAVLANDTDAQNNINPATVRIDRAPNRGGRVVVNPNGTITYTPMANFTGTESFAYRVRDGNGALSSRGSVVVRVTQR